MALTGRDMVEAARKAVAKIPNDQLHTKLAAGASVVVIDGGPRSGYKGASLRGHVEEVRDATMRARVYEALGRKYFGTLEQAKFVEIFGRVDDPETVYLRLVPEDGLTWEYGSN